MSSTEKEFPGHQLSPPRLPSADARGRAAFTALPFGELHDIFFEHNPQAMWVYDPASLTFLSVNQAALCYYGYTREEFTTLSVTQIRAGVEKANDRWSGEPDAEPDPHRRGEEIHRKKDGSEIHVQIVRQEIEYRGAPAVLELVIDVTVQKRTEKALRDSYALYQTLVENLPVSIFLKDRRGVFTYVNQGFCEALGKPMLDVLGKHDYDFYPVELADKYRRDDVRVMESGEVFEDIEENRLIAGRRSYVQVVKAPLRDSRGQIVGVQGVSFDFTEHKRVEEERDQFFQVSTDMMCIAGFDGYFKRVNPAFEKVLGYTNEEIMGRPYLDFVHEDDRVRTAGEADSLSRGVHTMHFENRYRRRDGTYRTISWRSTADTEKKLIFAVARDITEERRAEEERKKLAEESEALFQRLQLMLDHMPIGCIMNDQEFRFTYWNPAAERIFGYDIAEVRGKLPFGIITTTASRPQVEKIFSELANGGLPVSATSENVTKDNRTIICEWNNMAVRQEDGTFLGTISMCQDVTDRHRAEERLREKEEQLRQSQKMEAVGQLAGGVAHDFNNMLTVMAGYSEILLRQLRREDPLTRNVEEIKKATERATSLTRQLLAFSRKQVLQPSTLNLNAVVKDIDQMLRRLIGEQIEFKAVLEPFLGAVKADRGQLEQILMNLVVNARDAMPAGGKLTVETANVALEDLTDSRRVDVKPGPYVMLSVSDTGTGMPREVKERVFEPFFTTKELGKGTGLGLSTVYGIVKQSGGHIYVYSEIGHGTTFKIYLPRAGDELAPGPAAPPADQIAGGRETILVVEDEEIVRTLAREILRHHGYRVLVAANGVEALQICSDAGTTINLMLTDLIMPHMGGRELAERAEQLRPDLKILFTSGYTDDAVFHRAALKPRMAFIEKPFAPDALARKVRQVLDQTPPRSGPLADHDVVAKSPLLRDPL